jgi:malonyl-CoA decarboxylase
MQAGEVHPRIESSMSTKAQGFLTGLTRWWGSKRVTTTADFESMASVLLSGKGEASGVALASRLLEAYRALPRTEHRRFFQLLANRYGPDLHLVQRAVGDFLQAPDPAAAARLHVVAEPRRQELIRRMNLAPRGTSQLVAMREDLLTAMDEDPSLAAVDADFRHLFASWFNRGFLALQRIDWSTPAHILEKIIQYEAVHAISSWDDLRLRLEPADRRCFAFFHPALTGEPLIFVEVALTTGVPTAIAPLLSSARVPVSPERATTAVFYSISNCQRGLRGISFGNFLIKQVAEDLKRELPSLNTFVTLSPLPGFCRWLSARLDESAGSADATFAPVLGQLHRADWHRTPSKALREALSRAAVRYLFEAKDGAGKPIDAVERFHLGNGARLERLNWMGDESEKGLDQGAGFMVNYLYDLAAVEANHEAFANQGEIVASPEMQRLERNLLRI